MNEAGLEEQHRIIATRSSANFFAVQSRQSSLHHSKNNGTEKMAEGYSTVGNGPLWPLLRSHFTHPLRQHVH
ncbi:hypothetical protein IAD21_02445 [Abditibacteriota bacterium]|nr:hypothetical protein IAD21_02445 [Abditibacteriota bacterium]